MSERVGTCVCGRTFSIPIKRGRPRVRCDDCQEAYANGTLRDRLASLGIDPDLALPKRIKSHPTPTPNRDPDGLQRGDEAQITENTTRAQQRIKTLELLLKSRNQHISQQPDKN